jgi:hypothetical protein
MNTKYSVVLLLLVAGLVMVAGCSDTSSPATPAPTPIPTSPITTGTSPSAPNLVPNPTDVVPTTLSVTIAASKDPITGDIVVTFNGGKGMDQVNILKTTVIASNGVVTEKPLKAEINSEAIFTVAAGEATTGTDRVMAKVWYNDGSSYIIYDKILSRNRTT